MSSDLIPKWYVGPGVVIPSQPEPTKRKVTPPGPKSPQWFEPIFQKLRDRGDRLRWINDEVWILPGNDCDYRWYRDPMNLGPVEVATAVYFDRNDELRDRIIAAYHDKVKRIAGTRGLDEAHRVARDEFTLRGGSWDGIRNWYEIDQACAAWNK